MKKSFLLFFISIFFACDNEIDINDEWRDIPVIYAIFDSGSKIDGDGSNHEEILVPEVMWDGATEFDSDGDNDDQNMLHLVRVQKSFLGDLAADSYMDVPDSIYYDSDELDVWVERVNVATGQTIDEYPLEIATASDLESLKDDGDFHSNNHYLFKLKEERLDVDKKYRISVRNTSTGVVASAETNIVAPIDLKRIISANSEYNNVFNTKPANAILAFSETGAGNNSINFENEPLTNAKMYSVVLIFNYLEQSTNDYLQDKDRLEIEDPNHPDKLFFPITGVQKKSKKITLESPYVIEDPSTFIIPQVNIGPSDFLNRLGAQFFNQNDNVYRYPLYSFLQQASPTDGAELDGGIFHRCIDIHITAVNLDFYTYFEAGTPMSGINQERPIYNNIDNGAGHMSSRSQLLLSNMRIDNSSQNQISTSGYTKDLNFACYKKVNGLDSFQVFFGDDCN